MSHVLTVRTNASGGIFLDCSCGEEVGHTREQSAALDALNEKADEHIRAAERARIFGWT